MNEHEARKIVLKHGDYFTQLGYECVVTNDETIIKSRPTRLIQASVDGDIPPALVWHESNVDSGGVILCHEIDGHLLFIRAYFY